MYGPKTTLQESISFSSESACETPIGRLVALAACLSSYSQWTGGAVAAALVGVVG